MFSFGVEKYGPEVNQIVAGERLCDLGPGRANQAMADDLAAADADLLFSGDVIVDRDMARCCLSALWLLHDFVDESHAISQEILSTTGSYWHGIMHRREPDYSNAKYWFRRVGDHPIFPDLCASTRELASGHATDADSEFLATQSSWDPYAFVDLCQAIASGRSGAKSLARQTARLEWEFLFDFCYRKALNSNGS